MFRQPRCESVLMHYSPLREDKLAFKTWEESRASLYQQWGKLLWIALCHSKLVQGEALQISMTLDFQHYSFRMPNIGFQNLPLNIYIVVFGTAIFVFILSLLFCCYLIRLRHQAHKELYAYKQVIQKEKVKELNLHEICAVCLEEFKQKDELGICPCKHAFHRKCLIKWLEVRKVCPLCNMPVLQLAQQQGTSETVAAVASTQQHLPGVENLV
ncbi:RING finger protein 24 isoform X1 [Colossoma macropomum]|uniref:RING finger protein 24 isoform X1 n=2 Tax=Colossoma macropomum TaxID=42526 RepID=UPI0018653F54|nr:RING finger protein 24 isoform X1 [Colossoma macropomum]